MPAPLQVIWSRTSAALCLLSCLASTGLVAADTIGFSLVAATIVEGDTGTQTVSLTVRRSGSGSGEASVSWSTAPGTALPFATTGLTAIAGGSAHTLALTAAGQVLAWGDNFYGQCDVPPIAGKVIAIAAGGRHSVALTESHQVVAWGDNSSGQCSVPAIPGIVTAIAAGSQHTVALCASGGDFPNNTGTVSVWGSAVDGKLNVPNDAGPFDLIAAGTNHTLARRSDGQVVA